jgi:WD40 repeat protein
MARSEPIWLGDPFRGLDSYEFEHSPIFFGQDAAITKAIEQLAANARSGRGFLLISGASGSGKSSLVKAGIVPRLMKPQRISGKAFLRRVVFRPASAGPDPILGLSIAVTRADDRDVGLPELLAPGQDATQLAKHLRVASAEPGYLFANALGRLTIAARQSGRLLAFEDAQLVLVVDQLEELFLPGVRPEDREMFIQLLAGLARSKSVWVIATLRADFWYRALEIPLLITLAENSGRVDLAPPSGPELAEMIRRPAQTAGLSFETHRESGVGLDAVLADDAAASAGALPLLSFTLDELYRNAKVRNEAVLRHANYEAMGGLEGAIAKRADDIIAGLPAASQAALPRVLRSLTTVAGTTDQAPIGREARLETFAVGSPERTLVDSFIAARLLVAESKDGSSPTVRLAHEALINRWHKARDQLATDRRDLETRVLIERQFERWRAAGGAERRLLVLRDPDLANARDLAGRWRGELAPELRAFVSLSDAAAKATARGRWALALVVMIGLAVLAAASIGALYVAERQRSDALTAQSLFLARDSRVATLNGNSTRGLLLALAALPDKISVPTRPFIPGAEDALELALSTQRERLIFRGHEGSVSGAVFSSDGSRIVTGSRDDTARVWDARSGSVIWVLRGHRGPITRIAFSGDGNRILTGSTDGTVGLWDAASGFLIKMLRGHEDGLRTHGVISDAAFSPDSKRIVTASLFDHEPRIWDARTGEQISTLVGHKFGIRCVKFSPDSRFVATGSMDSTTRVWDADTGTMLAKLGNTLGATANFFDAEAIAFSGDGERVATGYHSGNVQIWNWKTQNNVELASVFKAHDGAVNSVEFSRKGDELVTSSSDGTARIWGILNDPPVSTFGSTHAVLRGHTGGVNSATFSADGNFVLTSSDDGTARVWSDYQGEPIYTLAGHDAAVASAVYSPDEKSILTASLDSTARLWSMEAVAHKSVIGRDVDRWEQVPRTISAAAYSPDGNAVLTASLDGQFRLWDSKSGAFKVRSQDSRSREISVATFSPDGSTIVTGGTDKLVRRWRTNGTAIGQWAGHESQINSVAISPDGSKLVSASDDRTARVWNINPPGEPRILRGHTSWVRSAAFSPDGARILTVSNDHTARLWNSETGEPLAVIRTDDGMIVGAAFSPNGAVVLTWSSAALLICGRAKREGKSLLFAATREQLIQVRFRRMVSE